MHTIQYLAVITATGDACRVRLAEMHNQFNPIEFSASLGANSALTVNRQTITLGELYQKLIEYKPEDLSKLFDERGQLEIGRYLFEQLFGGLNTDEKSHLLGEKVELRIITEDETIARLPWALLYGERRFLAATDWTISLSASPEKCKDVELIPSPKIMVVMPQPLGLQETSAEMHFEDLERILSGFNHWHVRGKHLFWVDNWEDFQEQLPLVKPDILYYYGHGNSNLRNSQLIFAERKTRKEKYVSAAELANILYSLGTEAPMLAYINCCLGDTGGLLGIGKQISSSVPAVITNCTMAQVDVAQVQALDILRSILLDGLPPHRAIAAMRKNLCGQAGSLNNVRWLTPVSHITYKNWNFKPPKSPAEDLPTGLESTLDRILQTGAVLYHTGTMLQENKLRTLVFLWYGTEGQGIEPFYDRLEFELQKRHGDVGLYQVRPEFPIDFYNFNRSISDMMAQSFAVHNYEEIFDKIRIEARKTSKRQTIIYLRLQVIRKGMEFYQTELLKNFLEWLNEKFAERFNEHIFVMIGLAYVVQDPINFREALTQRIDREDYDKLGFYILETLSQIKHDDIFDFLRMHKIYLPQTRRRKIIGDILKKTCGDYEKVLEELKLLIRGNIFPNEPTKNEFINDGEY